MPPGLCVRPIVDPAVTRTIHLAIVAGWRLSPAVATFIKAIDRYRWPERSSVETEDLSDTKRAATKRQSVNSSV